MLEVKNVSKEFDKKISKKETIKFLADNDISFTANEGEVVGILGPNGAGKTTLLRMIAGIMKPTSGDVIVDGKSHINDSIEIKKSIAFLTGNTKLYKDISPYELLVMFGQYHGIKADELDSRINEIIKKFDMESFKHQKIDTLSTGQYQRTSISRCLVHDPKYYILDEATSSVDTRTEVLIQKAMDELLKNRTSIIIAHRLSTIVNADLILVMKDGRIVEKGTHKELLKLNKVYAGLYNAQF